MNESMDEANDEIDDSPVARVLISAIECKMPITTAPSSIFDLAGKPVKLRRGAFPGGWGKQTKTQPMRADYEDGVTRVAGDSYPMRSTAADE